MFTQVKTRNMDALPSYKIEVSKRAKYMRIRISLNKGVVVVVPKTMSRRQVSQWVPEFVYEQQQWIRSTLHKLQAEIKKKPHPDNTVLPDYIVLKALQQSFIINYISQSDSQELVLYHSDEFTLQVTGNVANKTDIFQLLEQFFKVYAYTFLKNRLNGFSRQFKLPYQRLTVRAQKTRWGSCSEKKNINLNYRLIFLEAELMDYVLLHELAHIRHMNHSRQFWEFLESMCSDAGEKDRQLNDISKILPDWLVSCY